MSTKKVTGPMYSGKSFCLISDFLNSSLKTMVIKPVSYIRDWCEIVSKKCNVTIPCFLVGPGKGHMFNGIEDLFIDEAQGFSPSELKYYAHIVPNASFYGLEKWADGTFTPLGMLECENTLTLTSKCKCGKKATETKHISGSDPITAVYEPSCIDCWEPPNYGVNITGRITND